MRPKVIIRIRTTCSNISAMARLQRHGPRKAFPAHGEGDREAVEEAFILHLPCSHDIIDIEKEATVDGCPLHVSQNDREVWALGGHFFVLLSLPRVYPREKQAIAKLMTSMTVLYIFVSSMQIPSFQLRSAARRQSLWRAYKIPPSIK